MTTPQTLAASPDAGFYTVQGFNADGSAVLRKLGTGIAPPAITAPAAPVQLAASSLSPGDLTVSWQPPLTDGGSAVTGYVATVTPGAQTKTLAATARSVTWSGLAGGSYTVAVVATNAVGQSPAATVVATVQGQVAPTPTPPPAAATPITHGAELTRAMVGPRVPWDQLTTVTTDQINKPGKYEKLRIVGGLVTYGHDYEFTDCVLEYREDNNLDNKQLIKNDNYYRMRFNYCYLDGRGMNGKVLRYGGYWLYRCLVRGAQDDVFGKGIPVSENRTNWPHFATEYPAELPMGATTVIDECFLCDLAHPPQAHADCVQINSGRGLLIRRSKLLAYNLPYPEVDVEGDPASVSNACLMVSGVSDGAGGNLPIADILGIDNYLDGGNSIIKGGGGRPEVTNNNWRGNRFGPNFRYSPVDATPDGFDRQTNVWAHTGTTVADNGTVYSMVAGQPVLTTPVSPAP